MKQEAILKAAKKLFSKFGFKKVSMDEIAREAEVTKKTVYANFSSKEDLLNELIKYELKSMKNEFESIENKSDDFFEGIEQGLISLLVFRKKNNLFKVLFEEAEVLRNKSLNEAQKNGYIVFDNIDVLTFLIYKMYIALIIDWNNFYKKLSNEEISSNIMKILRNGIERK